MTIAHGLAKSQDSEPNREASKQIEDEVKLLRPEIAHRLLRQGHLRTAWCAARALASSPLVLVASGRLASSEGRAPI